jgi:hypothetical protein
VAKDAEKFARGGHRVIEADTAPLRTSAGFEPADFSG